MLRNGSFFVDINRETGGTLDEALRFNSERLATTWVNYFAPLLWLHGYTVCTVSSCIEERRRADEDAVL